MKKTKGFTLVELVVVIAIIGVLASILVPTMLTYIRKAKLKAANTNAKTAYHAVAQFVANKNAQDGSSISVLVHAYGHTVIDCNVPPNAPLTAAQQEVHDLLADNGISAGHVWVDITQINGETTFYVQWTGDSGATNIDNPVVGQYPDPVTWDTYNSDNNHFEDYIEPA